MPAKVKIKILSCRNLPIMDKSNLTTDAFVEIKLGNITYKTDVKRKTLNPVFNSQWFRFEIDDQEIQDELLHIRVMDYDTYSANDAIGKVCLGLNPLLLHNDSKGFNGWYPIYDTIQGIRGEIQFVVKVELFSDSNKFRQSSCGVHFFHSNSIPVGYHAVIRGFVEEMIVDDDPEHDWIDKIRRASASNEARQQTFLKLAGQIQRKIGLKAINLGGNAVLGFQQKFDLEKDTIIARGIGTSVTLVKIQNEQLNASINVQNNIPEDEKHKFAFKHNEHAKVEMLNRNLNQQEHTHDSNKLLLQTEPKSLLLNVPSIYVDSQDTASTVSTPYDGTSMCDIPGQFDTLSVVDERSMADVETVSMIVRNVEEMDKNFFEIELRNTSQPSSNVAVKDNKKHHDFIHDLKGSIQEKFHHLVHHEGSQKKPEHPHKSKVKLHDFKENVSGKFHQIAERIHHIHLPHVHHHQDSLVSQAMQTILLEQFNIAEASTAAHNPNATSEATSQKRKSSSSSLQSIKQKFHLFQRPRRSVDIPSETSSLNSISEINPTDQTEKFQEEMDEKVTEDSSSVLECNIHADEEHSVGSFESTITVLHASDYLSITPERNSNEEIGNLTKRKAVSKEDLKLSVRNFDSYMSNKKSCDNISSKSATFTADTNKKPLHESLLSLLSRNELSVSPNVKTHARTESIGCKFSASPSKQQMMSSGSGSLPARDLTTAIYRRSSDSDLSITPKGNSLTPGFDRNAVKMPSSAVLKPLNQENMDMLEYPFLTLTKYPAGFIIHMGATVSARSVKLLDKSTNPDDMETRDSWFNELRMEIRGHAKSLGCNVVLGYSETVSISDDVTVLSASGTAAVINLNYSDSFDEGEVKATKINPKEMLTTSVEETFQTIEEGTQKIVISSDIDEKLNGEDINEVLNNVSANTSGSSNTQLPPSSCNLCHIPYARTSIHIGGANIGKCNACKRGYVPDVILATIELPDNLQVVGTGCLIQASVCRPKRDLRSESNAKEISDGLPFLEYELHRLLINKLKMKGMNAIFRLNVQVTIGDKIMSLIASGTAVFLSALHPPIVPKIVAGNSFNESSEKLAELQKTIQNTVEKNRETYNLTVQPENVTNEIQKLNKNFSDTEDSDEEKLDYAFGNKQTCILEIDDIQDLELFNMLMEQVSQEGIKIVNGQSVPGCDYNAENIRNFQMFVQVWRTKMPSSHQSNSNFARHFQRLLQSIFFKLRGAVPCHITNIQFQLDLPQDEIQLLITGMVLKATKVRNKVVPSISHDRKLDEELIFSLEEEDALSEIASPQSKLQKKNSCGQFSQSKMTFRNDKFVDITPLSFVPGAKIEKYLGNLNFCFIRETQNVRDYGGICGFVHSFITELLSIVRAHINILGGNMMIAFYMTELLLVDNPHKNQAQCLVNVGGDAVCCTYDES